MVCGGDFWISKNRLRDSQVKNPVGSRIARAESAEEEGNSLFRVAEASMFLLGEGCLFRRNTTPPGWGVYSNVNGPAPAA